MNAEPLSAQEILDQFKERDENAVSDYNNFPCLEGKIEFINGRLADVMSICAYLLKKEIEREKQESS